MQTLSPLRAGAYAKDWLCSRHLGYLDGDYLRYLLITIVAADFCTMFGFVLEERSLEWGIQ